MGCDIHFHTEIKVSGKWLHYGQPDIKRDYMLFSLLANVRNPKDKYWVEPVSSPRGLPFDVSETTDICSEYDGSDGHSHSYITSKEILQVEEFLKVERKVDFVERDYWGYLFGNSWTADESPDFVEDVRFVFWFDN